MQKKKYQIPRKQNGRAKKLTENGSGKATLYVGNIKHAMPFFMGVVHMLCSMAAFLEDS